MYKNAKTMKMSAIASVLAIPILMLLLLMLMLVPNVYAGGPDDAVDCYKTGVNDGLHGPFKQSLFDHCDRPNFNPFGGYEYNPYYKGFIDGCIDADNDKEICERFTD